MPDLTEPSGAQRFHRSVVLVTGSGSGIGRVLAQRFAREGAVVAAFDVDAQAAADTAGAVSARGGEARSFGGDVTSRIDVARATDAVIEEFGRIDILVNNAAVASDQPFDEITDELWDRDVAVTLRGGFVCSQVALPAMVRGGGGVIVNIGSVNGMTFVGQDAYSAAKAGLLSLTRGVAVRYAANGVRCNLVAPGSIRTPAWDERLSRDPGLLDRLARWYPLGRVGTPDDVADAVLFLASDQASWITGTCLSVDGGLLAGNPRMRADILGED